MEAAWYGVILGASMTGVGLVWLAGFHTVAWLRSRRKRPEPRPQWRIGLCFEATCRAETERFLYCPKHRIAQTSPPSSPPSSKATALWMETHDGSGGSSTS